MKTGDLVETRHGIGELVGTDWETIWVFGRKRNEAWLMVKYPDGYVRVYASDEVWPYNRPMSETTPQPEPQPDDDDNGDEEE